MTETRRSGAALVPLRVAFRMVHLVVNALRATRWRWRRARLVASVRFQALLYRCDLHLALAGDVQLGRGVRVVLSLGQPASLEVAARCSIGDDVRIELRGGSFHMGAGGEIRSRCHFILNGRLHLDGANVITTGVTIHCDELISLGQYASMAEYCTLADSSHKQVGEHEWFGDNVVTGRIVIDAHVWLAPKVTVIKGVHIGERCVVASNSVVVRDLPAGHWASGVPAKDLGVLEGLEEFAASAAAQAAPSAAAADARKSSS
jgi:maltose O-acetyltransferase